MVYGDSLRSCTVAIIVPQSDRVKKWATESGKFRIYFIFYLGVEFDFNQNVKLVAFKKVITEEIDKICKEHKLSGLEKPKDIFITTDAFSIENNLLTPTFKLKRNIGRDYFKSQIDTMYAELAAKGF
jgi:long-chain acyl-CoA synthetase